MTIQNQSTPAAVTVTQMAELCGLSRSRFYSLIADGVFPPPVQQESAKRPVYVRELIEKCLEIRRTGVALDGQRLVTFNRRRQRSAARPRQATPPPAAAPRGDHSEIVTGLQSLGLEVTESQVAALMAEHFPDGVNDAGEAIRKLFLAINTRND